MTPYRDRHEQNEYELGTVGTAVMETEQQTTEAPETETVETEPDGDSDDDDEDAEAKFQCDQCERSFSSERGLAMHQTRVHAGAAND